MAHVGTATQGKVLTATGVTSGASFKDIGSLSGLTQFGVVVAEGTNAFQATTAGTNGQVLIGSTGANPAFNTITSSGGTITFTSGANTLNMEAGGGTVATTYTTNSGNAIPAVGVLNVLGATVAAGTSPLVTAGAGNTVTINAQRSQALGAADATKVGLSNFSSADFAVAATGFVTLATTGAAKTITGDSGGALSPTANNWNILGGPGVTTTGSGSTLTINSVVFTDTTATTMAVDNGYFATAAGTYNLPATAAQGELIHIICDTAGAVIVDAPALNFIRVGSLITAASGTATSTSIGDSLTLRYRLSSLTWEATSVIGTWLIA